MKKNSILHKVLALSLAAAVLAGTGFTVVGSYVGTSGISVSAAEVYGDFEYEVNDDNTVTVTRYTGNGGDVTTPSEIDGKSVTYIEYGAFSHCTGLTSIAIPNSVTSIGNLAFEDCTGLTSITIPDSMTTISPSVFLGCTGLTNITIPDSVTKIGDGAFLDCTGLTSITIPDSVTSIGDSAFHSCTGLTSITIPDSVTSIGNYAFYGCTGLKSITIPDSVTSIGNYAFYDCTGLTSITIPDSVTSIGNYAFYGCTGLTNITIPNRVTSIGNDVFAGCTGLTSVSIGNSIASIGSYAFEGCTGLTSITIPDSVTYIANGAFEGCTGLTSITIPDSVTSIGYRAFYRCTGLTIYGTKGSYAETYAKNNHIPFVSDISAKEIVLGETVTVNAKAVLGDGDYTYAVLYRKKTDTKWTVKQNYSTNDTIVVKPAKATDYDVCVKVKDSTGKIVKKFFEVKVNEKLKNTSTISAATIKKGNTVTLNGSATGGMGGYTYAVLYKKKAETKWTTRQGYKDNSEILVRPYTNTDYDICIKVKDKTGTIAKKYFTVTVTK